MPIINNTLLAGAAGQGGGYTIDQSIRFNDNDSAYLNRTPGSASDRKKWTWSGWLKRGALTTTNQAGIFSATSGLNQHVITFNDSNGGKDTLEMYLRNSGGALGRIYTPAVFRDPSAWYHCVFVFDSANATAADRMIIYVNGARQTVTTATTLTQNTDGWINYTYQHDISRAFSSNTYLYDGYMAEINFIDGQALTPTDFGEFNSDGVWIPKQYAGTYGTNGFYITGANSADLGADDSGNGNDFTSSGLTSDDQMLDTPTDNKLVWNGLQNQRSAGDASGTTYSYSGSTRTLCGTTIHIPSTGKWVAAFSSSNVGTSNYQIGLLSSYDTDFGDAVGSNEDVRVGFGPYTGSVYLAKASGPTSWSTGVSTDVNDTLWIAVDADNDEQWAGIYDDSASAMVWFGNGGTTGDIATRTNPTDSGYIAAVGGSIQFCTCARNSAVLTILDIEDAPGYASIPADYKALSTANLPTQTIADGSAYFQTTLFTGTGAVDLEVNQSENSTFQPDFVWAKQRNKVDNHILVDAVRAAPNTLYSNSTAAEVVGTGGITSFDPDGFTVSGDGSVWNNINQSGINVAAWQWLAGNGTASNEDGDITSTVSANQTSGFSIVSYTGNGSASQTVGHGLGVTPKTVIIKPRSSADHWLISNWETGVTAFTEKLKLNDSEAASSTGSTQIIGGSSTTFTIGTDPNVNGSGTTYIAYCWAEIDGFSKFGSYTGNGNANGPFVWCGFRPAFVIIKRTDAAGENWQMQDSTRNTYNVISEALYADLTSAESTSTAFYRDFLSNGFKIRASHAGCNASGGTYIFMAFAEHPFGGDNVSPVPAR